jgi:hypothetical protein
MIGCSEPQKSSKCFVIFGGDVDSSEMSTAVELGKHDGVETIRLAMVTGLARNE